MNKVLDYIKGLYIILMVFNYSMAFLDVITNVYIHSVVSIFYLLKKILAVLIALSLPFCQRNKTISLAVLFSGVIVFLLAYAFFPARTEILRSLFFDYFGCILVFCSVVSLRTSFIRLVGYLLWCSRIVIIVIIYSVLTQLEVEFKYFLQRNYMFFANALMVPLSFEIYSFIVKRNIYDAVLSVIALLFLFLGSRGSMLSMILLILFLFYQNYKNLKIKNLIFVFLFVLVGIYFLGLFIDYDIIDFSSNRTFKFLTEKNNWADEDRFKIWAQVIKGTSNLILGDGVFADRQILMQAESYTDVMYAHNVFVESFSDFGLVGLSLMIVLYCRIVRSMFRPSVNQSLVIVYFFVSAFQLLFSRSVLLEYNFFILIGLIYNNREELIK